jgi:protein TIF31
MLLDGAIQLQPEQNGQAQEALTVKDSGHTDVVEAEADTDDAADKLVHINVLTPLGRVIQLGAMPASDVLSSVKQTLLELGETCSFTAYHLSYAGEGDTQEIILNDYVEMLAYPFLEGNVTLKMVLEPYDVKKARFHVRRFKDLLQFPPAERLMAEEDKEVEQPDASASEEAPLPSTQSEAQSSTQLEEQPTEDAQKDLVKRWKKALDQRASLNKALRAKLPDTEIVTNASLTDYFDRTLHSLVEDSLIDIAPEPCLQHITYSAWNPPPNHRKMQGDLLYLQVQTFDDGTLHITCTRAGFYVNRTSHSTFDPQPALNCHFSHELLYTLLSASPSFLKAWSQSLEKANDVQRRVTNPLVNISAAVKWGNLAVSFIRTPWLVPVSNGNLRAHIADATRAEDDLLDTYGLDDKSVVREWCAPKKETGVRSALAVGFVQCNMSSSYIPRAKHFRRNHFTAFICVLSSLALLTISLLTSLLTRHDELQTVRDLNPRSMHEKLMKQRFIYKVCMHSTELPYT